MGIRWNKEYSKTLILDMFRMGSPTHKERQQIWCIKIKYSNELLDMFSKCTRLQIMNVNRP